MRGRNPDVGRSFNSLWLWRISDRRTALQKGPVRFGRKQQTATVNWKGISVDYTRFR